DGPFYHNRFFLLFETIPIFFALIGLVSYSVSRYLKAHPMYAASLAASRQAQKGIVKARAMISDGKATEFYELVFRILQDYLGKRRLKHYSSAITSNIVDEIDTIGLSEDLTDRIKQLFNECYIARYATEAFGAEDMRKSLETLIYIIDNLDRKIQI
ncbi:MAG: hypothetical protein NC933_05810, partial [Candidatus Omnitrophica bacterium]|nr:hypothetical protein [Candidatus Omnitrophota bacterium]